jgi:hypothetical protein
LSVWNKYSGALEEKQVLIGGLVCTFGIASFLFARDLWKAGTFVSIWGPVLFNAGEQIRQRVHG